jgi:hypothetical protein
MPTLSITGYGGAALRCRRTLNKVIGGGADRDDKHGSLPDDHWRGNVNSAVASDSIPSIRNGYEQVK